MVVRTAVDGCVDQQLSFQTVAFFAETIKPNFNWQHLENSNWRTAPGHDYNPPYFQRRWQKHHLSLRTNPSAGFRVIPCAEVVIFEAGLGEFFPG